MATPVKQNSNNVGLRYAEEESLKTLPTTPVWRGLQPNSYGAFGAKIATIARDPINASRQRQKGTITDVDAEANFPHDFTQDDFLRPMQGFLFADAREKASTAKLNVASIPITAVDGAAETYAVDNDPDLGFLANHLVLASGFAVATNNGLKKLTAVAAGLLTASGLDAEVAPPAAAKLQAIGYEFAVATVDITIVGGLPRLARVSGAFDLTTLGFIPGEWIFLGADATTNVFANNQGWARVGSVAATYIEFDSVRWTPQAEVGTGKNIRIFFGTVVKNESDPDLIKTRTYQFERTLGEDGTDTQAQYLPGSVANKFSLHIKEADKVTSDLAFMSLDEEFKTGTEGLKTGDRPALVKQECFNTSSDASIRLVPVTAGTAAPTELCAYGTSIDVDLSNNASADKAIGVVGGFDITVGNLEVSGKGEWYFATNAAVAAIRANSDIGVDIALAKQNAGVLIDLPLLTLGDGQLKVEKNKAILLPFDLQVVESKFGHTFLFNHFAYLPTLAC